MDTKKNEIMERAGQLFLRKGYHGTSIQDIAAACSMSKATIYKYLASKEEIGINVVLYTTERFLEEMRELSKRGELSPKERLRQCVLIWIKGFLKRTNFTDAMVYSFSPEQRELYVPLIHQARAQVFLEYAQMMEQAYPGVSEAASWELALNLNGLTREIAFLQMDEGAYPNPEETVDFIMDSLAAIAEARKNRPSLLGEEQLVRLKLRIGPRTDQHGPAARRKLLMKELRARILTDIPGEKQEEYLEAAELLEEESRKPVPRQVILDSLCVFLAQQNELSQTIQEWNDLFKGSLS